MGINTEEKINFLNNRISSLQVHIDILSTSIMEYPEEDVDGKPTRQSVLDNILNEKQVLLSEVQALNNQG
jgi:hypothetical protein